MALQGEEVSSAFFLYSTTGPHSNISLPTDVAMTDADPFLCVQPCPHTTGSALTVAQKILWRQLGHWQILHSPTEDSAAVNSSPHPLLCQQRSSDVHFLTRDKISWVTSNQLFELVELDWYFCMTQKRDSWCWCWSAATALLPLACREGPQRGHLTMALHYWGTLIPFSYSCEGIRMGNVETGHFCSNVSTSTGYIFKLFGLKVTLHLNF